MLQLYILCSGILASCLAHNVSNSRAPKQLSVFTVVKFPNEVCLSSTSGRNGTCYTQSECAAKGGSSSGSCASSFGVCCVFEKSCGDGSIAENCTYFTSASRTAGSSCTLTICKQSSDVCQLRLDFETFTLSNPVDDATRTIGEALADDTQGYSRAGACDTDFFSVSTPNAHSPPLICGENTGLHMYIPASDSCNVLSSYFGSGTTTTTSAFTIKVTQVKCDSKRKAPHNCLQYFTAASGTFQTYNWVSGGTTGRHLINQDYCYCFRADRTSCTMCYNIHATGNTAGLGLGPAVNPAAQAWVDTICGVPHGGAGESTQFHTAGTYANFDHIVIPGGQCPTPNTLTVPSADRYCGIALTCLGDISTDYAAAGWAGPLINTGNNVGTICTSNKPFQVCLKTDGIEDAGQDAAAGAVMSEGLPVANSFGTRGFKLDYWQSSTCLLRN